MENQVEALHLDGDLKRMTEKRWSRSDTILSIGNEVEDGDDQELKRITTSDGRGFNTSDKWAAFYPNQKVTVVTSIGQPPIPPDGYVPLRHGHRREVQNPENCMLFEHDVANGFSVDTLLWSEKLLEERIMQLTAWTRRSPLPRRQKLERINRMVNQS
ncbi:unnamed protein product [Peronospora effusa]|uniref:HNH nuclease domain-containing protein n=1 Tax=Peronospora farinosa TaxID=134698 RepID=A0AAV0UJT5_9STRA|nr:unnamed protein product [Peronospora farinosa]CAI5700947.1 unnamed protein product [Peronospora effusa]CAI5735039.1 unnamed protein product [Peronospora farinosa]